MYKIYALQKFSEPFVNFKNFRIYLILQSILELPKFWYHLQDK